MSTNELREGREVSKIAWMDDTYIDAGWDDVAAMYISMAPGNGGMEPWVFVKFEGGDSYMHNCRHIATIKFKGVGHG